MAFRSVRAVPDVGSAREFIVAQLKAALGERVALTKADLEQDPALSALLELFRYADRNGDDRLSLGELEDYFKLVERGMRALVWIKVMDHGQNPFYFLDSDGDGRLSYRELARASDLMSNDTAEAAGLPRQLRLSFGGPSVKSWGGVPIPAVGKRPPTVVADTSLAPRWFQVMDRNGDGVISPREFVGPPEVFRKLDADGDGVISPEEARRAGNH
jgi:Ca2+-binding EF-hand superfamily protein